MTCFAACGVGLETLLARELATLARGRSLQVGAAEPGGVEFTADLAGIYAANLHLRTASRVVVRIGAFHASTFHELERRARRLPWRAFVSPGTSVEFRVTSRKSRLYHQEAIAQRLQQGLHGSAVSSAPETSDAPAAGQLITVRVFRDECTVSADSSGELLHRRGYRLATAKAPLRETLGAAMLLGTEWNGSAPLLDPMCGSGTIPIEAALLAREIPPGLHRRFAFEEWPEFDAPLWSSLKEMAMERILPSAKIPIVGSDRDEGAVAAALTNAQRAGVAPDIEFRRAAISAIEPPAGAGWLVTNPPYGVRVGERVKLRNLYAQLGNVARRRLPGWHLAMLSAHVELERQVGLSFERVFETVNGGIRVGLMQGMVPETAAARG